MNGVILFFVVGIIMCVVFIAYDRKIVNNIAKNGIKTQGAVSRIDKDVESDGDTTYTYYVEYKDQDGGKHESIALVHSRGDLYKEDQRVAVKYVKGKYKYALIVDEKIVD